MNLLKKPLPVLMTGLLLLCSFNQVSGVDIKVRRFGGGDDFDNNDAPSLSDSTNFGTTTQITMARRFQFKPTGSGNLVIYSVTVTGTNASEFVVQGFPGSISTSWNTFVVRFNPVSSGTKNANIVIRSNAEDDPTFTIRVRATANVCLPGNGIETSTGLHVSSISTVAADGWTCFCNSSGRLLLSLNTTGSGAAIPSNGVQLQIGNRRAIYFDHGDGFVGNIVGFTGIDKTWAINPTSQPVTPVGVRLFFTQADTLALRDTMRKYTGAGLNRLSNIMIYNVTNNNRARHSSIANLTQNDVQVYDNGPGSASWRDSALGGNMFRAQFSISNLNTIGLGASPGGITPLPVSFISQKARRMDNTVRIDWQIIAEETGVTFIIERSSDGRNFRKIGTVNALPAATPGSTVSYSFTDANLPANGEWITYRITAMAENGEQKQAPTIAVRNAGKENQGMIVYRNQSSGIWNISLPEDITQCQLQLFNSNGHLVFSENRTLTESNGTTELNTSRLPAGIYILKVNAGPASFSSRILTADR